MLVQDAVSRRMCRPPLLSSHAHLLPSFFSPPSHYNPPGLIISEEWEVGFRRAGGLAGGGRQSVLCKRLGLDVASRELTQHAFLPGLRRWDQGQHRSLKKGVWSIKTAMCNTDCLCVLEKKGKQCVCACMNLSVHMGVEGWGG